MTEWQVFELPDQTLIKYRDAGIDRIGVIVTDETNQKRFLDISPNAKMTYWVISQWEMYDIATEAEATRYLLENA